MIFIRNDSKESVENQPSKSVAKHALGGGKRETVEQIRGSWVPLLWGCSIHSLRAKMGP